MQVVSDAVQNVYTLLEIFTIAFSQFRVLMFGICNLTHEKLRGGFRAKSALHSHFWSNRELGTVPDKLSGVFRLKLCYGLLTGILLQQVDLRIVLVQFGSELHVGDFWLTSFQVFDRFLATPGGEIGSSIARFRFDLLLKLLLKLV